MGVCKHCKLGESINGNLPILNTLFLDYTGNSGGNNESGRLYIKVVAQGTVNYTFAGNLYIGNTAYRTGSLSNGAYGAFTSKQSELGTSPISKFVKIENAQNLRCLCCYRVPSFKLNYKDGGSGLNLLKYLSNLVAYGGVFDPDCELLDVRYIYLAVDADSGYSYDLSDYNNIEVIYGFNANRNNQSFGPYIELNQALRSNTSINTLYGVRPNGNVANLPVNIRVVNIDTTVVSGNIEDFVSNARSSGRTSGSVVLVGAKNTTNVKYNNTSIATLISNGTIAAVGNDAYLTWTSNAISFASSKPSDLNNYYPVKPVIDWVDANVV